MKIYIAGAITGTTDYHERFQNAQERLSIAGYDAVNPLELDHNTHDGSWESAMRLCIQHLMQCDQVYVLRGWQHSKGATLERQLAGQLGIPIKYESQDYDNNQLLTQHCYQIFNTDQSTIVSEHCEILVHYKGSLLVLIRCVNDLFHVTTYDQPTAYGTTFHPTVIYNSIPAVLSLLQTLADKVHDYVDL